MRLQADRSAVIIVKQSLDLLLPRDVPRSQRAPNRLPIRNMTILRVHVNDAVFCQPRVAAGKRIFARAERIRRIPHHSQMFMRDQL